MRQAHNPRRVLVIDDEASFTRMVKLNLESTERYTVEVINESRRAYEAANTFQPDIILLDVVMPEADGGDVSNQIRQHPSTSDIPIIFVSAMVSKKESGNGFFNSGGEHFLAKPVTTETLVHSIEHVLAHGV
ncbi:response regulator [Coraliomargarita akajimensis]|uniref:Response regulator receiver protein n=1 Tax=Coraliomargarita akajimensis (strain DSM 45221 / IAM 15411 / JCM 23193 / KCTC 12865 / 04OKA010-24) TaxID=583355 RepID=D5EIY3_CORAD|nr:response regulator [Coraliomargarita akajimensis]ADE54382.1 response regulator receiver protein [Coraliomargarita akajimensis DSM 45221]